MTRSPHRKNKSAVPLGVYLRRWRTRRHLAAIGVGVLLSVLIAADRSGYLLDSGGDWSRYEGKRFKVTRVIDGDTIDIHHPDKDRPTTRIRLWGIDTPELARPDKNRPAEPFAEVSTGFTRRLCEGQSIGLKLEPHRLRGRYGRLLAYVELPDGTMLNERLLSAGLARAEKRFSHRWLDRFISLELQAKREGVGMWHKPKEPATTP